MAAPAQPESTPIDGVETAAPRCEGGRHSAPSEASSTDPEVLRAALLRESLERRRAECRATMQAEVVNLALDLLVREPDVEGFFGGLTKAMVEESESYSCAMWLLDEPARECRFWMAYVGDRLLTPTQGHVPTSAHGFPCDAMAAHLFA